MKNSNISRKSLNDTFLRLTVVQIFVFCAVIVLLVVLGHTRQDIFTGIKDEFSSYMENEIKIEKNLLPTKEDEKNESPTLEATPENNNNTLSQNNNNVSVLTSAENSSQSALIISNASSELVSSSYYSLGDNALLPVNGTLTSSYGERIHPVYGGSNFHSGTDLAADEGSNIYAALDGEVIAAGVGESSGNYVKLSHSGNIETFYGHCSRVLVKVGTKIRKGDVIALVGHTGTATGPHLHFELHINGVLTDPAEFLSKAVSSYGN